MKVLESMKAYLCSGMAVGVAAIALVSLVSASSQAITLEEQTEVYNSYALEAKGDYAGAAAKLAKVEGANSDSYFLNYRLGYLFSMAKKYPNALMHYEKAAQLSPSSVEPHLAISLMSLYTPDDSKVISASKEVLKRDSHNYFALLRLAGAEIRKKEYSEALEHAKAGHNLYPLDAVFLEQVGFIEKTMGKSEEATKIAKELILISPANVWAKGQIASAK